MAIKQLSSGSNIFSEIAAEARLKTLGTGGSWKCPQHSNLQVCPGAEGADETR